MITIHKSITITRVVALVERRRTTLDDPGLCFSCGKELDGVDPDARQEKCPLCDEHALYGIEEVLFILNAEPF